MSGLNRSPKYAGEVRRILEHDVALLGDRPIRGLPSMT